MKSFLLKYPPVSTQLLVALLLVLGAFPEGNEGQGGVQCHECKGEKCQEPRNKTCERGIPCLTWTRNSFGEKGGSLIVKDCFEQKIKEAKFGSCIETREGPGHHRTPLPACCSVTYNEAEDPKADIPTFYKVVETHCACITDLCNNQTQIPKPSTSAPGDHYDTDSQQQHTSNMKLIFVTLTAAVFYNYI